MTELGPERVPAEVVLPFDVALAFVYLYVTWWDETECLESDLPGYSLISLEDVAKLDRAAEAIEKLFEDHE